jgi:hypothetical protein
MDSIRQDEDQMKLSFAMKAFANILAIANAENTARIMEKFGHRLSKRLVHIINYEHMQELMSEALRCCLLMVQAADEKFNRDLLHVGIVPTLTKCFAFELEKVSFSLGII